MQFVGVDVRRPVSARAFYEAPGYSVFREVFMRMDPEKFAALLTGRLTAQRNALPGSLTLDGKMIREIIGTISVVDSEGSTPVAVGVMDQKEGTERCELKSAQKLLASVPSLDGQRVKADPLHCQKEIAR